MFFRFGMALCLIVLVALWGTSLEKQNLELKRAISQQHYRPDALLDLQARLRLEAQRLGTPANLMETLDRGESSLQRPKKAVRSEERRSPRLDWNSE